MLADTNAIATIAVKDLEAARRFYEDTLRLSPVDTGQPGVLSFKTGSSSMLVYESEYAGTNKATAATWVVGAEVDAIARELAGRGVAFEHYDMPHTKLEGDVHVAGDMRVAWFKDPDGNIHCIVSG